MVKWGQLQDNYFAESIRANGNENELTVTQLRVSTTEYLIRAPEEMSIITTVDKIIKSKYYRTELNNYIKPKVYDCAIYIIYFSVPVETLPVCSCS